MYYDAGSSRAGGSRIPRLSAPPGGCASIPPPKGDSPRGPPPRKLRGGERETKRDQFDAPDMLYSADFYRVFTGILQVNDLFFTGSY